MTYNPCEENTMNEFQQKTNEPLETWYMRVNKMERRTMTRDELMRRAETLVHITALKKATRHRRRP